MTDTKVCCHGNRRPRCPWCRLQAEAMDATPKDSTGGSADTANREDAAPVAGGGSHTARPEANSSAPPPVDLIPAPPAFDTVTATLWQVQVAYKPEPENDHTARPMMLISADPTGAEIYALVKLRVQSDCPKATEIYIVQLNRVADVFGTVVRKRSLA